jgi:hypothetical protein
VDGYNTLRDAAHVARLSLRADTFVILFCDALSAESMDLLQLENCLQPLANAYAVDWMA